MPTAYTIAMIVALVLCVSIILVVWSMDRARSAMPWSARSTWRQRRQWRRERERNGWGRS